MVNSTDPIRLNTLPSAPGPEGVTPNFEHPYSNSPVLVIVGSIFMTIMLAFVYLRIYTKVRIIKRFYPDDYTCVAATIGTILYFAIVIYAVTRGHFGTHIWELTVDDITSNRFLLSGFFCNWFTALVWPFVKLSFFLLYIQLFRPMKWLRYCSYAGAIVNVLFYASVLIATLAFTVPAPGESFLELVQTPRQAQALTMALPIASMSLVLDVYILVLPITAVCKLQLSTKRKLGVILIFLTGIIACIASSLSIYYKWKLGGNKADVTYETMPVLLMSLIEMCAGITASCMPSLSSCLHHLPSWGKLSSKLSLRSFRIRWKLAPSTSSASYRKNGQELDSDSEGLNKRTAQHEYAMAPVGSVRTYIDSGEQARPEEDGIHLQYSIGRGSVNRR